MNQSGHEVDDTKDNSLAVYEFYIEAAYFKMFPRITGLEAGGKGS